MKYGNECEIKEAVCCGETRGARQESLTEVMISVKELGGAALSELQRIRAHLFGKQEAPCENEKVPECFRDDLETHRKVLARLTDELHAIADQLGA